jgi:hypothetical protein
MHQTGWSRFGGEWGRRRFGGGEKKFTAFENFKI